MHLIEQAFGKGCDLYEVLGCSKTADKAQLRKSYYRSALKFHPDRNPDNPAAHQQFQAISLCYQILSDPETRTEYDETGVIPSDAIDEDDREASKAGVDQWRQYFDQIFGKVTTSDIDNFASKYKCSDEEKRDVLKEFKARKGNLVKMLEFVLLSEPRDAQRWVEDFILPAMEAGELDEAFRPTMEKTLKTLKAKAEKENKMEEASESETETEDEDDAPSPPKRPAAKKTPPKTKAPPKKAKASKAKHKKDNTQDLVAQIQNKNRGASVFASLGARYGVSMDDDDPLSDEAFAKAQSKLKGKGRRK